MGRKRFVQLALGIPLLGASLAGCRGETEEGQPGRVVRGTVLDAGRSPVSGALVRVLPRAGGGSEGRTDAQGRFEVPFGARGTAGLVEVVAAGFGPAFVDGIESRGGDVEAGTILLHAPATLAGTVRTERGDAVAGAQIFVSSGLPARAEVEARTQVAIANEEGKFEARGLPAGRVRVGVRAEGYADALLEKVKLSGGETTDLEIGLRPETVVEGSVFDNLGAPLAGARVVPTGGSGFLRAPSVESDAQGRFRLGGLAEPPGGLRVSAPGFPPKTFEPPPASGRFPLERGRTVTLRAERADGREAPAIAGVRYEVHTRVDQGWRRVEGNFEPEEREVLAPSQWRFSLPRGGETRLFVKASDGSSVRAEQKIDSDEVPVVVRFDAPAPVRGRVTGPAPEALEGLPVELSWGEPGEERTRRTRTRGDGSFRFEDVPPGWGELRLRSPDWCAEPVPFSSPVAEEGLEIRAVAASRIRGRLTYGAEPPGEIVPVRAFVRTGRSPTYRWNLVAEGATAPDGSFLLAGLPRGLVALAPKRPPSPWDGGIRRFDEEWPRVEFETSPSSVRVPPGEEVAFDVALPPMKPTELEVAIAINGRSGSGTRVDLFSEEGGVVAGAATDEDGTATIRLERGGVFDLRVVGAGFSESQRIEVADGVSKRIDLEYPCGGARGLLVDAEGKGLELRVDLERAVEAGGGEEPPVEERVCGAAATDESGRFTFREVVPGRYKAVAYDTKQGHATIAVGPFEVRAGEETDLGATTVPKEAPLRITLRSETGKFPFASAKIAASPEETPLARPVVAWIPQGEALVHGLPPRRLVVDLVLYGPWKADAMRREVDLASAGPEAVVSFEVIKTE